MPPVFAGDSLHVEGDRFCRSCGAVIELLAEAYVLDAFGIPAPAGLGTAGRRCSLTRRRVGEVDRCEHWRPGGPAGIETVDAR